MLTRMEKYYNEEGEATSLREQKNEQLYKNISDYEVDNFEIRTNATVLDNNAQNIDIEQIKKILDTRYNKTPKRRSIALEEEQEPVKPDISLDETREYDINVILQRARNEQESDYERERVKKVRDTQFDILKNLDLEEVKEEKKESPIKEDHEQLVDLINTITTNELLQNIHSKEETESTEEIDPLDILTDLKGEDNTIIVGGVHEEESISETAPIMSIDEADKIKPAILEEQKQTLSNTLQFTQSDFDDFNDLKKDVQSSKALIYTIIGIVSVILIVGLIFLLKHFLNI